MSLQSLSTEIMLLRSYSLRGVNGSVCIWFQDLSYLLALEYQAQFKQTGDWAVDTNKKFK